jgi:hypothetical protein
VRYALARRHRGDVGGVDLLLLAQHLRREPLGVGDAGLLQPPDDAREHDGARTVEDGAEDLPEPGARERQPLLEGVRAHPLGDVEDAEPHVTALVAGDQLQDAAKQGMRRLALDALEDVHREALEEELLRRDDLQRIARREERVEHRLGAGVDGLERLVHLVDEAAVGEVVARFVHRLGGGVVAVVLLARGEDEGGADVLRDALADLEDVQHAAERAPRGAVLHRLGKRLERRRLAEGRPGVRDERIVGLDGNGPVDVALEVPVGGVGLREERRDAGMARVGQVEQVTRSHEHLGRGPYPRRRPVGRVAAGPAGR